MMLLLEPGGHMGPPLQAPRTLQCGIKFYPLLIAEVPAVAVVVAAEDVLGDEDLVHLVRAVGDAEGARALVHAGEREVSGDAGGAPYLNRAVNDAVVGVRYEDLNRRDVRARV